MKTPKNTSRGIMGGVGLGFGVLFLITLGTAARYPPPTPPLPAQSGICLQEVVVFRNADSVGIVWSFPPCDDRLDLLNPEVWEGLMRGTAILPSKCGIIFRLPGFNAPIIDTLPTSPSCTGISNLPRVGEIEKRAEG